MPAKAVVAALFASAAWAQESKAVAFLVREVPAWKRDNGCYSCHNNGDGARALLIASKHGYEVPAEALRDTLDWLRQPEEWDKNRGNPASSDKLLARIQFTAALAESGDVRRAAPLLIPLQSKSGAWTVDAETDAGSPCTYGPVLATYFAREAVKPSSSADRATAWLRAVKPRSLVDVSALLLAFPEDKQRLNELLRAQASDGGWGPQPSTRAEVFDTALAMTALVKAGGPRVSIGKGRKFLLSQQEADGGWPETTRPSGSQSFAQRISTTAWATIALILTNRERD